VARTRIFHDFYGIFQITKKLGVIAGVDYGMEQKSKGSTQWNNWYGAALILRYKPINKTAIAVRAEYYRDDNGVIIETGTPYGFNTTGLSANFDYHILENVLWRLEYKEYVSADNIFSERSGTMMNTLPMATTSISISF
jgi:hypothetical protein